MQVDDSILRKILLGFIGLFLAFQLPFSSPAFAAGGAVDAETVARLESLIKTQQRQLEQQQQQLEDLRQQVGQFKQTVIDTQAQTKDTKAVVDELKSANLEPVKKAVTSGSDKVKLATNIVNDGDNTDRNGDDGYSVGATVVQIFNDYGAEFYAQYRVFSLDHADIKVHDINVATI